MEFSYLHLNLAVLYFYLVVIMSLNIKSVILLNTFDHLENREILMRRRRQLLYQNSSLFQFNAGIATPVIVDNHTLSVNWLFQANFQLPWNRTQIPTDILVAGPGYTAQARENTDVKPETDDDIEDDDDANYDNPENSGDSKSILQREDEKRDVTDEYQLQNKAHYNEAIDEENRYNDEVQPHHVYKFAEDFLTGLGHNGSGCILRAICQLGAEPLHSDDEEDLLFEISQYLLSPLSDSESYADQDVQPYARAHSHGLHHGDCQLQYPDCRIPLVDIFTSTYQ